MHSGAPCVVHVVRRHARKRSLTRLRDRALRRPGHQVIKAPRSRVWQALSNAEEFGEWFGAVLKGKTFVVGQTTQGQNTHSGYEHMVFDVEVVEMKPEEYFSYRWHPFPIDPAIDYSKEPTTLVEFTLTTIEGGTLLKVVESGFDGIPLSRRPEAFRAHSGGWEAQLRNIDKYVAAS